MRPVLPSLFSLSPPSSLPSLRRVSAAVASATLALAAAAPSLAADDSGLVLRAVQWEVTHEGQPVTIHGIAAEGHSVDIQGGGGAKPVRALLMPVGWEPEPNGANARLVFSIRQQGQGEDAYQIIDLEFGAAMVDLGELDDAARAEQIRQVALEVLSRAKPEPELQVERERTLSLPEDLGAFRAAVQAYIEPNDEAWQGGAVDMGRARDVLQQASDQEILARFHSFWPMLITRSVTAGAEGTNVVLLALPSDEGDPGHFVCFSKFLGGTNHKLRWNLEQVGMNIGDHVRVDIKTNVAGVTTITNEAPTNVATEPLDWAQSALTTGWAVAFP